MPQFDGDARIVQLHATRVTQKTAATVGSCQSKENFELFVDRLTGGRGRPGMNLPVAGYLRFRLRRLREQSDKQRNSRQLVPVGTFPTFSDLNGYAMRIIRGAT
jgi:hypothetical protein